MMRDKKDAVEFIRTIDTTHHSNIRVVIPPKIFAYLKEPDQIKFVMESNKVIITAVKK